jgi:Lrp/AsnC family transcriptional regulator
MSIKESNFRRNQRVDAIDRRILDILQNDASVAVATIAEKVGLSTAPCWRRIKRLDEDGVITRRVALLNRRKVNVPMTVFVSVKAPRHEADWLQAFRRIGDIPEIVEAWRLTGETDYLLRIVVPDVETYDAVYQRMIKRLEFSDINSSIAMEEMKFTTAIPTSYMELKSPA